MKRYFYFLFAMSLWAGQAGAQRLDLFYGNNRENTTPMTLNESDDSRITDSAPSRTESFNRTPTNETVGLTALSVSQGRITPVFSPYVKDYTAIMPTGTLSVFLCHSTSKGLMAFIVPSESSGNGVILYIHENSYYYELNNLHEGNNVFIIAVAEPTATTPAAIYTLNVKVASAATDSDTTLKILPLNAGTLSPDIKASYTATVPNEAAPVTATANDAGATITVTDIIGVNDAQTLSAKLYPNPFNSDVRISGAAGASLRVYDAAGHLQRSVRISSDDERITLGSLPAGVYLFRLEKDGNSTTLKGVKR